MKFFAGNRNILLSFNKILLVLAVYAMFFGAVSQATATTGSLVSRFKQTNKFVAPNPPNFTYYTQGVAISGNTAVLNAPFEDGVTPQRGAVYIYERSGSGWSTPTRIARPDNEISVTFGRSIAINGDTLIISASNNGYDNYTVGAYVYVRSGTTWTQQGVLTLPASVGSMYVPSVTVDGDTAVIGIEEQGPFIFTRTGGVWSYQTNLTAPNTNLVDYGVSVSLSGNTLIVGASYSSPEFSNIDTEAAYVFTRNGTTWTLQQRLIPTVANLSNSGYGYRVLVSGDTAYVSSVKFSNINPQRTYQGRVLIFTRSGTTWTQTQEIVPTDAGAQDYFGYSLAISGDRLVIGSPKDSIIGVPYQGSAHIYDRVGGLYKETQKVVATDARPNDQYTYGFGRGVAVSGNTVLVDNYIFDKTNVRTTMFDYNDDGVADISSYRASNSTWYISDSQGGFAYQAIGTSTDKLAPADYDGDGRTDLAVFRNGTWIVQQSSFGLFNGSFGTTGDIPQPADVDGDGRAEFVVYRPSNGTWYVFNAATNQAYGVAFGAANDKPVMADYDGDGKADIAVARQENGTTSWYVLGSTQGFYGLQFGTDTDRLVPADYDGDNKADVAVFRPSTGTWYLLRSTAGFTGAQWGASTDLLAPADFDGDGKTDLTVFRPSTGIWYTFNLATNQFTAISFGQNGDRPIQNAYVY